MLSWVGLLFLPHVIALCKVLVQMGLQLLVADKPHATVAALELHSFVDLGDGNDVELFEDLGVGLEDLEIEEMGGPILGLELVVEIKEGIVKLWMKLAINLVLGVL